MAAALGQGRADPYWWLAIDGEEADQWFRQGVKGFAAHPLGRWTEDTIRLDAE
jgi:hypothetical protein